MAAVAVRLASTDLCPDHPDRKADHMRHRAKTRIGAAALTLVYFLLAFPLTAYADPGVGYLQDGFVDFGPSGVCYEDGSGTAEGGRNAYYGYSGYSAEDDHGYYAVRDMYVFSPTTSGISEGYLNLCGELSRQPSDDPVLAAVGAACQSGGELYGELGEIDEYAGVPVPTGSNGYGRITYTSGPEATAGRDIQFSDVRMVFAPVGSMVFKGEYTSSPGMPNASTGTAVIHIVMGYLGANDCLLQGGALISTHLVNGSVTLIPDVE